MFPYNSALIKQITTTKLLILWSMSLLYQ